MTQPDRPVTPNRSAGRIEDELWQPFLAWCRAEGISNTEAFRQMIRDKLGAGHPRQAGEGAPRLVPAPGRRSRWRGASPG